MNKAKELFSHTFLYYLYQEFLVRYRFKYVLPRVKEIDLDGVRLDVSTLPLKVRNRLMNGLYESHEKQICQEFLSSNDSVLELGGAIGFIGLFCQKKIGIRRYYTVEANPLTATILKRNYELNGFEPRVWNLALADADGTVELDVGGDFWDNSIMRSEGGSQAGTTVKVPAASMRTILKIISEPVNVLIVDIEGAEQYLDVRELPEQIDKIIIELHPKVLGPENTYQIIAAIIGKGFRVAREIEGTLLFLKTPVEQNLGTEEGKGGLDQEKSPGSYSPAGAESRERVFP